MLGGELKAKRKMSSPEFGFAVFAAETGGMEDQVVCHQSLHGVDRLLTGGTHFLRRLKAEGLKELMNRRVVKQLDLTTSFKENRQYRQIIRIYFLVRSKVDETHFFNFTFDRWTGFSSELFLVSWEKIRTLLKHMEALPKAAETDLITLKTI